MKVFQIKKKICNKMKSLEKHDNFLILKFLLKEKNAISNLGILPITQMCSQEK
jgi:hypothetical protein